MQRTRISSPSSRVRLVWLSVGMLLGLGIVCRPLCAQTDSPYADGDPDGPASCLSLTPQTTFQSYSGTLAPGRFQDWCFDAAARDVLEFSLCSPEGRAGFQTGLEVLNGAGDRLLGADYGGSSCFGPDRARLTWTAAEMASYRLRLYNYGGKDETYSLGYRRTPVPLCTMELSPVANFQTVSGAVATGQFVEYCFNAIYDRTYEFTTCAPGSANFDTVLEVRDALSRTVLAQNDDYCGAQSFISWRAVSAGPLRVRIYGFGAEQGNFNLAYHVLPTPGCPDLAPEADFQIAEGYIKAGDYQEFCFDSMAGETYEFRTCPPGSADFASVLVIPTPHPFPPVRAIDCLNQSKVRWTAAPYSRQRVQVKGTSTSEYGDFRLAYRRIPCQPLTPETEYQIASSYLERGDVVEYCFTAIPRQTYEFSSCTPGAAEFASVIGIRPATGDGTFFTDATRCGLQNRLLWTARTGGTYRVRVSGAQLRDSGYLDLAYRRVPPPPCTEVTPGEAYQTTRGTLVASSFKDYCFDAQAGDLVEFSTCPPQGSATFGSSVDVRTAVGDPTVGLLESASCTNGRRVVFRAPGDGRYRARVSNQYSATGTFTLAYRMFPSPLCTEIFPAEADFQMEMGTLAASSFQEYCFDAAANELYEFTTCPPPGRSAVNTVVELRDATGLQAISAFSQTYCDPGRNVFFRPPRAGRYRVRVSTNTSGGAYTLAHQIFRSPWIGRAAIPSGLDYGHAVVTVDGILYLIGGYGFRGHSNQVWAYDPAENRWTRKADIPVSTGLTGGAAAALNGKIYVFGGHAFTPSFDTTWIYDAATNTWSAGARMPAPRSGPVVAAANDKIIIASGSSYETTTWEYDPSTNRFFNKALMPTALYNVRGGGVLRDGRPEVHVFGANQQHLAYDVLSDTWRTAPPAPFSSPSTPNPGAVVAFDQRLYVLGGSPISLTLIFDPATNTWLQGPPILTPITNPAGDAIDGVIFLMSGSTNFAWEVE